MVQMLDFNIVTSEYKFQSYYFVHFQTKTLVKGKKPPIPQVIS